MIRRGVDERLLARLMQAHAKLVDIEMGHRHRESVNVTELRGLLIDLLVALHEPRMAKATM